MKNELEMLKARMVEDFNFFIDNERMRNEYEKGIEFRAGRKYLKVLLNRSVWGFIVLDDKDPKFRVGDILKAASYNAPARNQARANVFEPETFANVSWTGPGYLR